MHSTSMLSRRTRLAGRVAILTLALLAIAVPSAEAGRKKGPNIPNGRGFEGITPTPAPRPGTSDVGEDATAIARWDVVPYQTLTTKTNVGVVAFHVNGILRVDFSANGGNWVSAKKPSLNPHTGVVEYWAMINPDKYPDGPIEVRAIAYPRVGVPRVLEPLFLNTNAKGTLPNAERFVATSGNDETGDGTITKPYRTILRAARSIQDQQTVNADGGIINLLPGSYDYGRDAWWLDTRTQNRFLTIRPAPGVGRSEVRLVASGGSAGLNTKLVHIQNVTIAPTSGGTVLIANYNAEDHLWLESCDLIGIGRASGSNWQAGWTGFYATDCTAANHRDGIQGATLLRDVLVENIGSDAFSNSLCVINCTARNIDHRGTSLHPDVYQFYGADNNVILYGLNATENIYGQGLFAGANIGLRDIAFVNCNINNSAANMIGRVFQFGGPTRHMYTLNCNFIGPATWMTDAGFSANSVVFEHASFAPLGPPSPVNVPGVVWRDE